MKERWLRDDVDVALDHTPRSGIEPRMLKLGVMLKLVPVTVVAVPATAIDGVNPVTVGAPSGTP